MAEIVEGFIMGKIRNITDPGEQQAILDKDDLEIDEEKAVVIDPDILPDTYKEVVHTCEVNVLDTTPGARACPKEAVVLWTAPQAFAFSGEKFWLCEKHHKQVGG